VSFLACARQLFQRRDVFYPQFATHNAHSIATVLEFAGKSRDFEFQRLHGMGESLYEEIIEIQKLGVGCRIYAPVGQHEDLLAYLVRRLLENGANSSFVNRIQDDRLPVEEIIADPVAAVRALSHVPHPQIPQPRHLYGMARLNSTGVDLTDRGLLPQLATHMETALARDWSAGPIVVGTERADAARPLTSPADSDRIVGQITQANAADIDAALTAARKVASDWAATPVEARAAALERAAGLLEEEIADLMGLCVAEAGKTLNDAIAEVREAVDFCRYYAARARQELDRPLRLRVPRGELDRVRLAGGGVFACISPWNFPLAIFCGQVTAALAAGNAVVAKPAEQTPLIAAAAVRLLHRAGIPPEVLHLLPGDGAAVGGPLVGDPRVDGVCFTGSTEVAQLINRTLAKRAGAAVPLIAETGGQNAMIVDSTALPEQVTRDVLMSAFQSAGQRCSALRVLFLQDDVAERMLDMLAGAMEELTIGNPALLSTDIGPVIDEEAQAMLQGHAKRMLGEGRLIKRANLGPGTDRGHFVAPTAFEIDRIARLQREVFGPILHVVRYDATHLDKVVDAINDTGYGLTMGIHTRIDETWQGIFARAKVGNTYINRNQIGAIVGVQPFGGQGLSGTGPKAGGPQYLHRFVAERALEGATNGQTAAGNSDGIVLRDFKLSGSALRAATTAARDAEHDWAATPAARRAAILEAAAGRLETDDVGAVRSAGYLRFYAAQARAECGGPQVLPGPTGERNELWLAPRGLVACLAAGADAGLAALVGQSAAALAASNCVLLWHPDETLVARVAMLFREGGLPKGVLCGLVPGSDADLQTLLAEPRLAAVALAGPDDLADAAARVLAACDGPIRPLIRHLETPAAGAALGAPLAGSPHYLHRFTHERTLSIDTTASGGNASLLSLGEEIR